LGQPVGRFCQGIGRLSFAVGVNDLCPLFALGFGLSRHRPLQALRQEDVLDLYDPNLDAPRFGMLVNNGGQPLVDAIAMRQQLVQIRLTQHAPQRGEGNLPRGQAKILHLDNGVVRIHHTEVDNSIYLRRNVVARDHFLGLNHQCLYAHIYLDQPVNVGNDEIEPRAA
jgi:hypothetical protein